MTGPNLLKRLMDEGYRRRVLEARESLRSEAIGEISDTLHELALMLDERLPAGGNRGSMPETWPPATNTLADVALQMTQPAARVLLDFLTDIEWVGFRYATIRFCPACGGEEPSHNRCRLHQALRMLKRRADSSDKTP